MSETPFWERPDIVTRFAGREVDHRLAKLAGDYPDPAAVRVLDLGCAGGRNAVFLAERGFDFAALDSSQAMVAETRRRVAEVLGPDEAERRVVAGTMTDLSRYPDGGFDLLVALGVFHTATSREEWERALDEAARVTKPGGRVLVAVFTDEHDPDGSTLVPVPGEPDVYLRDSGRCTMVSAPALDAAVARRGLAPEVPTEVVRRETDRGFRVTANALYRRGS